MKNLTLFLTFVCLLIYGCANSYESKIHDAALLSESDIPEIRPAILNSHGKHEYNDSIIVDELFTFKVTTTSNYWYRLSKQNNIAEYMRVSFYAGFDSLRVRTLSNRKNEIIISEDTATINLKLHEDEVGEHNKYYYSIIMEFDYSNRKKGVDTTFIIEGSFNFKKSVMLDDKWKTYSFQDFRFQVDMPSKPVRTAKDMPEDDLDYYVFCYKSDGKAPYFTAHCVGYVELDKEYHSADPDGVEKLFAGLAKTTKAKNPSRIVSRNRIKAFGYPAEEYVLEFGGGAQIMATRDILVENRLYQLYSFYPAGSASRFDHKHFINSFKLI